MNNRSISGSRAREGAGLMVYTVHSMEGPICKQPCTRYERKNLYLFEYKENVVPVVWPGNCCKGGNPGTAKGDKEQG